MSRRAPDVWGTGLRFGGALPAGGGIGLCLHHLRGPAGFRKAGNSTGLMQGCFQDEEALLWMETLGACWLPQGFGRDFISEPSGNTSQAVDV